MDLDLDSLAALSYTGAPAGCMYAQLDTVYTVASTGNDGRIDDQGFLHHLGRNWETIKVNGTSTG